MINDELKLAKVSADGCGVFINCRRMWLGPTLGWGRVAYDEISLLSQRPISIHGCLTKD